MVCRAQRVSCFRHRNLHNPQRHSTCPAFPRNNLHRLAPRKSKLFCLALLKQPGHQRTLLACRSSAVPPWILSSCLKISADCLAIESATLFNIFCPFSLLPRCELPSPPLPPIERT